ncbi:hypothetical protein LTR32_000376 [Rachicladosporium monterosium]|uniref:Uncharacterized protein n=1 Tax=Rachicladosporium monterosium TaxID=1507873 RepID=A0ABR0LG34_9PEZI|nr:hypothetical protein LTR32_000376 [Rachicladosporium monterosium]
MTPGALNMPTGRSVIAKKMPVSPPFPPAEVFTNPKTSVPYAQEASITATDMHFHFSTRRSPRSRTISATSSDSSLDRTLWEMTLPIAPREDDYNMPEKDRQAMLLAKCKRAQTVPFRNAKPAPLHG